MNTEKKIIEFPSFMEEKIYRQIEEPVEVQHVVPKKKSILHRCKNYILIGITITAVLFFFAGIGLIDSSTNNTDMIHGTILSAISIIWLSLFVLANHERCTGFVNDYMDDEDEDEE